MSRVINFRAWDIAREEMFEARMINFEEYTCRIGNGYIQTTRSLNEIELMQFTGLKDFNDIDVYEFDILQVTKGSFSGLIGIIEFHDTKFILNNISGRGEIDLFNVYCFGKGSIEIIGNVFQDTELLEGKAND